MNGGSREGSQKAISPSRCLSRLRTENSSDSDDLAKLLGGEDARWGGVSSPLLGYYMIIKTRGASAAIFQCNPPSYETSLRIIVPLVARL